MVRRQSIRSGRNHGQAAILCLLTLPLLLVITGVVVDVGFMLVRKAATQSVSDSVLLSSVASLPNVAYVMQDELLRARVNMALAANGLDPEDFDVGTMRHPKQDALLAAWIENHQRYSTTLLTLQGFDSFEVAVRSVVEVATGELGETGHNLAIYGEIIVDTNGSVFIDSYDSRNGGRSADNTGGDGRPFDRANATVGGNGRAEVSGRVTIHGSVFVLGDIQVTGNNALIDGHAVTPGAIDAPADAITGARLSGYPVSRYRPVAATRPAGIETSNDNALITGHVDLAALASNTLQADGGSDLGPIYVPAGGTYYFSDIDLPPEVDIVLTGNPNLVDQTVIYSDGPCRILGGIRNPSSNPRPAHVRLISVADEGAGPIQLGGNGSIIADVYAPQQDIDMTGDSEMFGRLFGRTVRLAGSLEFHFDESLDPIEGGVLVLPQNPRAVRLVD